jgi:hypothetical protein
MRLATGLLLAAAVLAGPRAEAAGNDGYVVGLALAVNLGPHPDRARVGVAIDAGWQRFWHETPWGYPGELPMRVGPIASATAQAGWTRPVAWAQVTAAGGALYPLVVADGGFIPAIGGQVGAGLGLATDGFAGPVLTGQILGPHLGARFDVGRWRGAWHAPRVSAGLEVEANCCSWYE